MTKKKQTKTTSTQKSKEITPVRGVIIEGVYYKPHEAVQVTPDIYKQLKKL